LQHTLVLSYLIGPSVRRNSVSQNVTFVCYTEFSSRITQPLYKDLVVVGCASVT